MMNGSYIPPKLNELEALLKAIDDLSTTPAQVAQIDVKDLVLLRDHIHDLTITNSHLQKRLVQVVYVDDFKPAG